MARKTLATNISFDDIYARLLFAAMALELAAERPDKEVAALAKPVNQILTRWAELDTDRRSQQRATIRARAACKWGNIALDAALTAVPNATLAEVEQDRQAALFTHLFPKPLSKRIKPALESQLKIVEAFVERLKNSEAPAALRKAHEKPLQDSIAQGEAAQKQRVVTQAAASALTTRVDALWEDANTALLHVEGTLKQLTAKRRLGNDWIDGFFPDAPNPTKKKPAEPSAAPAPTP